MITIAGRKNFTIFAKDGFVVSIIIFNEDDL